LGDVYKAGEFGSDAKRLWIVIRDPFNITALIAARRIS
jgi:hypothetical protein